MTTTDDAQEREEAVAVLRLAVEATRTSNRLAWALARFAGLIDAEHEDEDDRSTTTGGKAAATAAPPAPNAPAAPAFTPSKPSPPAAPSFSVPSFAESLRAMEQRRRHALRR